MRGWPKGKARSAESREKMRAAALGRTLSPAARAHIEALADAARGQKRSPEHCARRCGVPVEKLDVYRLYRSKGFPCAEARAAVLAS